MARDKTPPPEDKGDVPPWFMTYSDVITLLMTFFILLLTFASQEPESFERMKVSMFGGGGSDGFAGEKTDGLDRESIALRQRPDLSRITQHGTETPPNEPTRDGLSEGLEALDESSELDKLKRVTFSANRRTILGADGKLTSVGRKQIANMAKQLNRFPMELSIGVPHATDLPVAVEIAHQMTYSHGVKLGRVSVSTLTAANTNTIEFTLTRED